MSPTPASAPTPVPMSHPATVQKNGDGTYTVRVQHTAEGSITEVQFTNVVFAEALAKGYAAMLNGEAVVSAVVAKAALDTKAAIPDVKNDIKKAVGEAQVKAKQIIADAKLNAGILLDEAKKEASKMKAEAVAFYEESKLDAEQVLAEAKVEAARILHVAATKFAPDSPKNDPTLPHTPTPAPAQPIPQQKPQPVAPADKPKVVEDE